MIINESKVIGKFSENRNNKETDLIFFLFMIIIYLFEFNMLIMHELYKYLVQYRPRSLTNN